MFTGIVEELGTVESIEHGAESAVLRIAGPLVVADATHGASIAVNGVCLTVTEHDGSGFAVDVMAETLSRSSLGALHPGDRVNLERALPANGRFGGHIVQGHVDGTDPRPDHPRTQGPGRGGQPRGRHPGQVRRATAGPDPHDGESDRGGHVMTSQLASIEAALEALRTGRPVLVLDSEDRENEGDLVMAAETATVAWMAWAIRHTSGYLCAPMTDQVADRLELPLMVVNNRDPLRTAYTVSVDASTGVTTGISAADRLRTLQVLANPQSTPTDLIRPGHVLPLRAKRGGVLTRPGHTEATVDLTRLAGLPPVGVIGELVHDDGEMMRLDAVLALGAEVDIPVITIEALIAWRQRHDRVEPTGTPSPETSTSRS